MSSDTELKQAVLDELAWQPGIKAAHIGVSADAGIITLSGPIESFIEKSAAEMATGRVKGVKVVVEELALRLPGHFSKGDQEIAAAAIERLAWDRAAPSNAVKLAGVRKGASVMVFHFDEAARPMILHHGSTA